MHRCCNQLKKGCLSVKVTQIKTPIECKVADAAEHLQVCCSLVCGVNTTDKYLNVAPTMVWLTPDMLSGEFNIYSNVNWNIN